MVLKKLTGFFVCWLVTHTVIISQINHGPTLHVGYQASGINPGDLNTFAETFNAHYAGVIPVPLKSYSALPAHGFNAGVGYRLFNRERTGFSAYLGYAYAQAMHKNRAVFQNNLGYEFGLKLRDHYVHFEAGAGIKGRVFINACASFILRKTTMRSQTVYQDGTKSVGNEYDINGIYTGTTNAIAPGISVGGRIWHFFITGRALYSLPLFKSPLYLTDYSVLRYRSHDFPKDYGVFNTDVTGMDQENGLSANGFNGVVLQINLEFMIPIKKN